MTLTLPHPSSLALAEQVAASLPIDCDVVDLLTNRARRMGLVSRGQTSAGGSCELLRTRDGWVAVNLARSSDLEAIPAVVNDPDQASGQLSRSSGTDPENPIDEVARFAARNTSSTVTERFQLFGIAAATLADPHVRSDTPVVNHEVGTPRPASSSPVVVDLSSMWAGPLCARLLGRCDMEVIKVESTDRPDGARSGNRDFFEWLLDGHEERSLDLRSPEGIDELRHLVSSADVVIEASRPRALIQLGIDPTQTVAANPGLTWVSIVGYSRSGSRSNWVAFGDDAAVAGGLVDYDVDGSPQFCADAVADPLSGLFSAAAALESINEGGGKLLEVRMASVARAVAQPNLDLPRR